MELRILRRVRLLLRHSTLLTTTQRHGIPRIDAGHSFYPATLPFPHLRTPVSHTLHGRKLAWEFQALIWITTPGMPSATLMLTTRQLILERRSLLCQSPDLLLSFSGLLGSFLSLTAGVGLWWPDFDSPVPARRYSERSQLSEPSAVVCSPDSAVIIISYAQKWFHSC